MKLHPMLALPVMALLLFFCSLLSAQETKNSATVTVRVIDAAGGAIANAQVKFVPIETADEKTLATDATGKVQLELKPGDYDLIAAMTGFQTLKRRVNVGADGSQRFDLILQLGMCTDCMDVTPVPPEPRGIEGSQSDVLKFIESTVNCTDRPYSRELPAAGPACEKELFARRGRPFMFPTARNGIAYGVSSDPDKASELNLWVDNQSGEPVNLLSCCSITLFVHMELFDSDGRRVLSKSDRAAYKAHSEGRELVQVCTCSGFHLIPPHTIELFDFANISGEYALLPGRYTISERNPPATYNLRPDAYDAPLHSPPGLSISILSDTQ